jgi:hypothetical protein
MIDSGEVKNQTELARIKGISRARVTQISNLLKIDINNANVFYISYILCYNLKNNDIINK